MGQNLILNMDDHGWVVCAFNRTTEKVDSFLAKEAKGTKVVGAHSLPEMVAKLKKPRRVMLLVKGGLSISVIDGTVECGVEGRGKHTFLSFCLNYCRFACLSFFLSFFLFVSDVKLLFSFSLLPLNLLPVNIPLLPVLYIFFACMCTNVLPFFAS